MGQHVILQDLCMSEAFMANATEISVLVGFHVIVERILVAVALVAMLALVRPDPVVVVHVADQILTMFEGLLANPANVLGSVRVDIFDVLLQVDHEQATVRAMFLPIVHAFQVGLKLDGCRYVILRGVRNEPFLGKFIPNQVDRITPLLLAIMILQTSYDIVVNGVDGLGRNFRGLSRITRKISDSRTGGARARPEAAVILPDRRRRSQQLLVLPIRDPALQHELVADQDLRPAQLTNE